MEHKANGELLSKVGSMQQLAYIRPVRYQEGRAKEMHAFEMKSGPLLFTALADKCLDIAELSYRGINIGFLSKPGLIGLGSADTHGNEAQRSIMGGFLFTAGLENICAPCVDDGKEYPMHGRIRTTPGEHLCADAFWEDGVYRMRLSGEMREAELFGENITLRRSIETAYGSNSILLTDTVTNEGFRPEPALLLYHFNFGYPFLDTGARIHLPAKSSMPRDGAAAAGLENWQSVEPPIPCAPEQVFIHEMEADPNGEVCAALYSPKHGLRVKLCYHKEQLPYFMQWKSVASGDYVVGLEPANAIVYGRLYQKEHGGLPMLDAQQSESISIRITIEEDEPRRSLQNETV